LAIYSLHHSPIGKSTQAQPYTAAAHINYITRKRAMTLMQKARLPGQNPREVAEHLKQCEDQDRKNARVIDKVMLALPKELSQTERIGLIREFAEHVTKGRAPWLAAFHDKGKDTQNPHCHLVIRDRDPKTGKRVIGTSEIGSTERLRESWEKYANQALQRAGRAERIDRRTLAEQGIEREPTIHEGPQSQAMDKRGAHPQSRQRRLRNRPGAKRRHRNVDYRLIDKGNSRPQVNRMRRNAAQETERDYWHAIDSHNQARELQDLAALHNPHKEHAMPRPTPPKRQVVKDRGRHVASGNARKPREASSKPKEKLAKAKPRFKDLGPIRQKRDQGICGDNAKAATSHATKPAKPPKKWNARDQRALDRMKREREEDRARER
jgi:hypothetical protein